MTQEIDHFLAVSNFCSMHEMQTHRKWINTFPKSKTHDCCPQTAAGFHRKPNTESSLSAISVQRATVCPTPKDVRGVLYKPPDFSICGPLCSSVPLYRKINASSALIGVGWGGNFHAHDLSKCECGFCHKRPSFLLTPQSQEPHIWREMLRKGTSRCGKQKTEVSMLEIQLGGKADKVSLKYQLVLIIMCIKNF